MFKLDTYIKIIKAIGWTSATLIFLFIIFCIAKNGFLQFFSRRDYIATQRRVISEMPEEYKPRKKIITFSPPVFIDYSEYIMVPIGQGLISEEDVHKYDYSSGYNLDSNYAQGYYSRYSFHYRTSYNNILFTKKDSSQSYLLFDKKIAITDFYYPNKSEKEQDKNIPLLLLFGLVDSDYNKDSFLTDEDAVRLYISDLGGKNILSVTPENSQFVWWSFNKDRDGLYVIYKQDNNNDSEFNALDQDYLLEFDITEKKVTTVIIDDAVITKVKSIVF